MSISETISSWKQRAEIDYFSLFVPLWLAFDAWCKDKYGLQTQRGCLEALKNDEINNRTYHRINTLLGGTDSISTTFKNNLKQLNEALEASPVHYEEDISKPMLSFRTALIDRTAGTYEDLFRTIGQHDKIELSSGVFLTDEIPKIYKGYTEILYQIRCCLFHGNLIPNKENERIVKHLYLTLKDLLNEI